MLEEAIEPSASLEPAVDAVTVTGATPEAGVTESAATGGWFGAATLTVPLVVEVAPLLSVIVAVTVFVPAVA